MSENDEYCYEMGCSPLWTPVELDPPDENCPYCNGTGRRIVANGPDDYDEVVCDCWERRKE